MILFKKFDRLDFFITFICNLKWAEIIKNLLFNKSIIDCFNLIVKVFKLKLNVFMHDILKKKIFNKFYSSLSFSINVLYNNLFFS